MDASPNFGNSIEYNPVLDRFHYRGDLNDLTLDRSLTAYVYLTLQCNYSCRFCKRNPPPTETIPSQSELRGLFDSLSPNGQSHRTVITGGEPFILPNIECLLEYAASNGHINYVTTNGSLVRPSQSLVDSTAMFEIPLDGPDAETYTLMRGVDKFDTVMGNITELTGLGGNIRVTFLLTKANYNRAKEMPRLCHKLGIGVLRLQRLLKAGRFLEHASEFDLDEEKIKTAVQETREEAEKYGVDLRSPMAAPIPYGTVHIYPSGEIVTRRNPEQMSMEIIGNLHEGTIQDFWDPVLAKAHKDFIFSQNRL